MSENKIRNAHCVYFEGQTGLCKAKEFVKCNPVNCKLYTIDELSTILDLQEQLKNKEQECEKLKDKNQYMEDYIKTVETSRNELEQECEKLKTQTSNFMNGEYCADGCKKMYKQFAKAHNNLLEENKKLKQECQNFINTQYHLKNELKKYKKAVHKYKVILQGRIDRLHLSRRELLRELNSIPKKIACTSGVLKVPLDKFNSAIQVINNEDRYKKAIDKIEETTGGTYYETEQTVKFKMQDIQDIINRTKEQE